MTHAGYAPGVSGRRERQVTVRHNFGVQYSGLVSLMNTNLGNHHGTEDKDSYFSLLGLYYSEKSFHSIRNT